MGEGEGGQHKWNVPAGAGRWGGPAPANPPAERTPGPAAIPNGTRHAPSSPTLPPGPPGPPRFDRTAPAEETRTWADETRWSEPPQDRPQRPAAPPQAWSDQPQDRPAGADQDRPQSLGSPPQAWTDQDRPAWTDQDRPAWTDQDRPAWADQDQPAWADQTRRAGAGRPGWADQTRVAQAPQWANGTPGHPPETLAPYAAPKPRRRVLRAVGWTLAVLLVLGAIGGLGSWGVYNRSSAARWKARDTAARARLGEKIKELGRTRAEVSRTRAKLATVAADKAGVADQREVLSQIVTDAGDVTSSLTDCSDAAIDVANSVLNLKTSPDDDPEVLGRLDDRIDKANRECGAAKAKAAALEKTIDDIDD